MLGPSKYRSLCDYTGHYAPMKPFLVTESLPPPLPLWLNIFNTALISCFNPALCSSQENHFVVVFHWSFTCYSLHLQCSGHPNPTLFRVLLSAVWIAHSIGRKDYSPCRCQDAGGVRWDEQQHGSILGEACRSWPKGLPSSQSSPFLFAFITAQRL